MKEVLACRFIPCKGKEGSSLEMRKEEVYRKPWPVASAPVKSERVLH